MLIALKSWLLMCLLSWYY